MDPQDKTVAWSATDVPTAWARLDVPVVDAGHYQLRGEVARGGVGRIVQAFDTRLQREVALKLLIHGGGEEQRFIREALVTARLQHPSIVAIHEVGVFDHGEPFIAMKLVRGESLRESIRKRPTLAARLELVTAVLAVAEAVAYAHSQRVIHRDLKPSNVLLGSFGEVVVIDWGLAKHLDAADLTSSSSAPGTGDTTAVGAIVGTPAYMPPEQAMGRPVDERADVYSIGAMLYEVLTGVLPVEGGSAAEVLHKVLNVRPIPVERREADVPGDLAAIVAKAMMPRPSDRYPSAAELAADLRRFQLGQMVTAAPKDADYDTALETAFEHELNERTVVAVRVLAPVGCIAIGAFAFIPWLYHGRFVARDLWPRGLTCLAIALIGVAAWLPRLRRYSQHLGMAVVFFASVFFVVVNVLEHNVIAWFTPSMLTGFLACSAMLPLSPRRMLAVVGVSIALAVVEGVVSGMAPMSVPFLLQTNLVAVSGLVAYIGSRITYRIRRAEFYNRHRLQSANERLAKLERR